MEIKKMVQVKVKVPTDRGVYSDALYFKEGEVPADKDVEILAQERADAWVYNVDNPPVEVEMTKEELETAIAGLDETKSEYQSKLDAKIAAK